MAIANVSLRPSRATSGDLTSDSVLSIFLFLALGGSIIGLMLSEQWFLNLSLTNLCRTTSVLAIVMIAFCVRVAGFWSASSIYVIVFAIFHFGLTFVYGIGLLSPATDSLVSRWFYRSTTQEAIFLTSLGLLSCLTGNLFARIGYRRAAQPEVALEALKNDTYEQAFSIAGGFLVILAVGAWFYSVLSSGGVSLLFGSYIDYLAATASHSALTAFVWFSMGLGLSFLATTGPSRLRKAAIAAFVIFAVVALPLGLRGEVLFPTSAAVVILTKVRRPPSSLLAIVSVAILLFAIPILKDVRQVGVKNVSQLSSNPLDAFTELGQSLRPVAEVVQWRHLGDPLKSGATYWSPFDRASCRFRPGAFCIAADRDERIAGTLVMHRVGPIGFSPVAEAYLNFGRWGIVVVMFLIGTILGRIDCWKRTRLRLAFSGVIYVELLINIRNSFAATPAHLFMGFVLVYGISVFARGMRRSPGNARF